jgi:Spy/CpxP family protein refolding chaperone
MTSQGKVKLQVWMLIVAVFALGAVTGGSLHRLYLAKVMVPKDGPRHPRGPARMVDKMKEDLNLNDEQITKIKTIFEDSRKEFPQSKLFAECPAAKEMRTRTRARVREVLTTDQQKRYDEINAQRDAEMNKER